MKRKPNIIFILGDDLGWAELGCYGNTFNETPHLGALAARAVRFTDAYAAAPVCPPYRAALMTGQVPARVGITDYLRPNDPKYLSTSHVTIAKLLKRAGKSTLYEGGVREPLIVHWPGVTPAGKVCKTPTMNIDFCPTFAEMAGAKLDPAQQLDGLSIVPLLKDPAAKLPRDTFCWHYPLAQAHLLGGRSAGSIRQGDWKLIEFFDTGNVELYDLAADPSESKDLAAQSPEKAKQLRDALAAWRKRVGAEIPANCRDYVPRGRK